MSNVNTITATAYLGRDRKEDELKKHLQSLMIHSDEHKQVQLKLEKLQESNRGITYDSENKRMLDPLQFARYFLMRCIMFCIGTNVFYSYNRTEHCYQVVTTRTIKKVARLILDEVDTKLYNLLFGDRAYKAIDETIVERTELSATPGVIVFKNGTLYTNLSSKKPMEFVPKFSPKNIVFHTMPYDYVPDAKCPKFQKFLKECLQGDKDLIALLRDCCSNIFAFGESYIHHIVFIWGVGRNGKSVLVDTLEYVFPEMCSHTHLSTLSEKFGTSELVGKVLNISPESETEIKNTEILKVISAGSTTTAEFKFQDRFSVRITTKLFVATNSFPYTTDNSKGWKDRLTIIPFNQVFEAMPADGNKKEGKLYQNPHLLEELKAEREGIAAWLLEGLEELKQRGWILTPCKKANTLKQKVLLDSQPVLLFFYSCIETCSPDERIRTRTAEIHRNFKAWAEHNEVEINRFHDSRAFHKEFRRILELQGCSPKPREIRGTQHYINIKMHTHFLRRVCYKG